MKKQIQSYYSKLTYLVSGGIWIKTYKVKLQSSAYFSNAPPGQMVCERHYKVLQKHKGRG